MRWTHQYVQGQQLTQQYLLKPLIQPMLAHFLAHDVLLKWEQPQQIPVFMGIASNCFQTQESLWHNMWLVCFV